MDTVTRQLSNLTASTLCLKSKIRHRLVNIKDGIAGRKATRAHEVTHESWHPWQELKRLQVQENVPKELVPKPTWEPGIEAGYRPPYKPWRYYFFSLVQWHNETVNVWTHLIGSVLIVLYMLHFHDTMDYLNNPRAWPHLMLGVCSLICTSASGVCHLIHSKSAFAHYVTFSFDYAGAGIYGLGLGTCILFYTCDKDMVYYFGRLFLPILVVCCATMCFCICYGKVKYSLHHHHRRKMWFVISTVPPYACMFLMGFPRYVRCYFLNPNPDPVDVQSWHLHRYHLITFFAATFFFVSHVPEIYAYGEFDMLGQGHQLWHVFLVCTMVFQLYATHYDYTTNGERSPDVLANLPGYETCLYVVGILILTDLFLIVCASRIARQVVDEEHHELPRCAGSDTVDHQRRREKRSYLEASTSPRVLRKSTILQRRVVIRKL
ncbi:membrane progestin receptor alpha-like [Lineus longissimus]|uniref:membrane progestin receptor alpha-like n=1 Tax=Lineus longissimus TaxID=88925 RepID=UPI00315DB34B